MEGYKDKQYVWKPDFDYSQISWFRVKIAWCLYFLVSIPYSITLVLAARTELTTSSGGKADLFDEYHRTFFAWMIALTWINIIYTFMLIFERVEKNDTTLSYGAGFAFGITNLTLMLVTHNASFKTHSDVKNNIMVGAFQIAASLFLWTQLQGNLCLWTCSDPLGTLD